MNNLNNLSHLKQFDLLKFVYDANQAKLSGELSLSLLPRLFAENKLIKQVNLANKDSVLAKKNEQRTNNTPVHKAQHSVFEKDASLIQNCYKVLWSISNFTHDINFSATYKQAVIAICLRAKIWLPCQRCLNLYLQPLNVDLIFKIVKHEDQIIENHEEISAADVKLENSKEIEEIDFLVGSHNFDLLTLIEDELILSLPLVPKHQSCDHPHLTKLQKEFAVSASKDKPSPFNVLHKLKTDRV